MTKGAKTYSSGLKPRIKRWLRPLWNSARSQPYRHLLDMISFLRKIVIKILTLTFWSSPFDQSLSPHTVFLRLNYTFSLNPAWKFTRLQYKFKDISILFLTLESNLQPLSTFYPKNIYPSTSISYILNYDEISAQFFGIIWPREFKIVNSKWIGGFRVAHQKIGGPSTHLVTSNFLIDHCSTFN